MPKWTERSIGGLVVRELFQRRVLAVPNCCWTGNECDLLVVAPCLRIIDVEIKISRADLRADAGKDKWWHSLGFWYGEKPPRRARDWPHSVWKHYYCLPATVWRDDMLAVIAPTSGVLLIREARNGAPYIDSIRRARPNPDAKPIDARQAIDIARLAGLRMWDALAEIDRATARLAA